MGNLNKREVPTTLEGARAQFKNVGNLVIDDEGSEAPAEMMEMFNATMDTGFVAGVAWLLALIVTGKSDSERREEMPLILEGIQLEIKRETLTRERSVRKSLGDDKVDDLLRKHGLESPKKRFSLKGDDDEPAAPSLRDIEETRAAIKRAAEGPQARRDGESPDADVFPRREYDKGDGRDLGPTGFSRDLTPPSDPNGKDHGNHRTGD